MKLFIVIMLIVGLNMSWWWLIGAIIICLITGE